MVAVRLALKEVHVGVGVVGWGGVGCRWDVGEVGEVRCIGMDELAPHSVVGGIGRRVQSEVVVGVHVFCHDIPGPLVGLGRI